MIAVLITVGFASPARADTAEFGAPLPDVTRLLFGLSMPVPVSVEMRMGNSGGSSVGTVGAFDARIYFGHHGVLLGAGFAPGGLTFPSQIGFFDAGYSIADFSSRRFSGFNGSLSFDVGPTIMFVQPTYTMPGQSSSSNAPIPEVGGHATIGARVSAHADLFVGPAMIGLVLGYRGGVPTNASPQDNFEGIFFFDFEVGAALRPP